MIINNDKLIEQIITENSNLFEYDELDLNDQHILDELTKIKRIGIRFKPQDSLNIIEDTIKQLYALIEKCPNLELVSIFSTNSYAKKININNLIDLIVDHNIKRAVISGFDYDYLPLFNKILSTDNETVVSLDKIIDSENSLKYILGEEKLRKKLLFTSHGNDELNDLYLELRLGTISLKKYEKYKNYLTNYKDLYITIGNISELDISKLENIKTDSHIKGIYIKCGYEKEPQKYSFEEYENIRKVIDEIVQMVKLPKEDDTNREKLIFAQIYKILGKNIRYDYYAISDEGRKDKLLACNCRNLKNGLLGVNRNNKKEFLAVCAGYATILQNLCACFNIKCDYISSFSKEKVKPGEFIITGPREYENGTNDPMGHAYNAVYLDGKAYLCDLTWDADLMKLDKLGRQFLKSYDEFFESHKNEGFSSDNVKIITQSGETLNSLDPKLFTNSCLLEEQIQLFGGVAKENIDEMISEGYLADFAMKNIEYIKQVKGKVGMNEYMRLIQLIHGIEEYIKSPEFKSQAGWTAKAVSNEILDEKGKIIGKTNFIFYPGYRDLLPSDAVDEVVSMEEKQWKMK